MTVVGSGSDDSAGGKDNSKGSDGKVIVPVDEVEEEKVPETPLLTETKDPPSNQETSQPSLETVPPTPISEPETKPVPATDEGAPPSSQTEITQAPLVPETTGVSETSTTTGRTIRKGTMAPTASFLAKTKPPLSNSTASNNIAAPPMNVSRSKSPSSLSATSGRSLEPGLFPTDVAITRLTSYNQMYSHKQPLESQDPNTRQDTHFD